MKWDLDVLYKGFDDPRIESDTRKMDGLVAEIGNLFDAPCESAAKTLMRFAELTEETLKVSDDLGSFASLTLACDATNEPAGALLDQLQQKSVALSLAMSKATRYIGSLAQEELRGAVEGSELLKSLAYPIYRAREDALHLPDEKVEEWLLKMSLTGGEAFGLLRDKLDATLTVDYKGGQIPLSAARNLAYDADPAVRRDAYEAELAAYPKVEIAMAACLNSIKGEALTMIEAEKHDSVLDKTLYQSGMTKKTLDAMFAAIDEALPAFRQYLRRKGEMLGHPNGLPFYDIFAPMAKEGYTPKTYTAQEARAKLVAEMSKFTPEMGKFIDAAFENRWIDLYPHEGKQGGAFCASLHAHDQSRVLTNFDGSYGSVSTIAHELGHAWHNRCMEGLPYLATETPMPLAETASIFNETLLAHMVSREADDSERFTILEAELQDATQVIVDIYSRYLFESDLIECRKSRAPSVRELKEMMLSAQDRTYGDGLDKELRHPYMWACKSHYYSASFNFYNFPYAFGLLFGKGVFAQYLDKGENFVPTYNKLLRACGSGSVRDVAASVGIDVEDVAFWRASLKVITDNIQTFLELSK